MSDVTRYDVWTDYFGFEHRDPRPDGDWVAYDEWAALKSQFATLSEENERLKIQQRFGTPFDPTGAKTGIEITALRAEVERLRDRLPAPGSQYVTVADELVALLIAAPSQPVTLQITELGDGHLQFLVQEVDTRRLREDAERLEWLERQDGAISHRMYGEYRYYFGAGSPNARATIDAARAQEAQDARA